MNINKPSKATDPRIIKKSINVLTRPGMNIMAAVQCTASGQARCRNLSERNCCRIWAFPEAKWSGESGCPDYQPELEESADGRTESF